MKLRSYRGLDELERKAFSSTLVELRSKIKKFIRFKWPRITEEKAEDIVSFATEEWLSGRDTRTEFQYIVVDYVRKFEACIGARKPSDAMAYAGEFDEKLHSPIKVSRDPNSNTTRRLPNKYYKCTRIFGAKARIILKLRYEYGLEQKDIGELFGVTETRISHLVRLYVNSSIKIGEFEKMASIYDSQLERKPKQKKIPTKSLVLFFNPTEETAKKVVDLILSEHTECVHLYDLIAQIESKLIASMQEKSETLKEAADRLKLNRTTLHEKLRKFKGLI